MYQYSGEAETLTAAALAGCGAAVVATDQEGRVLVWNEAAADLFGWESEAVTGELCPLSPLEDDALDAAVQQALDGTRVEDVPIAVPDKGGTEHRLHATVAPLRTDEGDAEGVVATFTETERPTVARLQRRIDHLEAFADTVAHDLRGPLNAASSSVDLAQENRSDEHLDRAARCLDRIETIIEDLLTLNRNGETGADTTEVWLSSVVEDAWRTFDKTEAHLLIDDDICLPADRSQLHQLLANLLQNAVDHSDGADVTVRVGALTDRTGFYVADNGPGIPVDRTDSVFEYGYTTDDDGTGYGLPIVQRIADRHGWTVDVTESRYGGARFEVYENFSNSDA